jgi:26S proteasome non-ATPase regulatory subunit 9
MEFLSYDELKKQYDTLLSQKELLEIEADAIFSELTSPGVNGEPPAGLKEPLVDAEGFPRGDVDIYNVRNKRKRFSEINTDHKTVMKQIETMVPRLSQLLAQRAPTEESHKSSALPNHHADLALLAPIAKLDEILSGSPASHAGIQENDDLVQFGHIQASDPKAFASIAKLVGESVSKPIKLIVRRNKTEIIEITLTPQPWGGRGLLGCHLSPIKS